MENAVGTTLLLYKSISKDHSLLVLDFWNVPRVDDCKISMLPHFEMFSLTFVYGFLSCGCIVALF